jgi:peptidyl-prolyl cis-trans isomerase A (cyclophilin A)
MRTGLSFRGAIIVAGGVLLSGCFLRGQPLTNPDQGELFAAAPDSFRVSFETTKGTFAVMAHRAWAPRGVDRFYFLAKHDYYRGVRFFRVIRNFVAQFGINGDPEVSAVWRPLQLPDDSVRHSNKRGTISFASAGPNTRTVQLFINLVDNPRLDAFGGVGFAPIGEVVEGMEVVDSLYSGYGEGAPRGKGPQQDSIAALGNEYLERAFPELDAVVRTRIEREWK